MPNIALIGDSVLDNKAYTDGKPDVSGHLRALLPGEDSTVTLLAVDGTTTHDVGAQIVDFPQAATHVVLSLGGNDAMDNADLLDMEVESTGAALDIFAKRVASFEAAYKSVVASLVAQGRPLTVCTIYNADLDPAEATRARVALMMFNDVILREAFSRGLNVVDLRLVCTEPADFERRIEPSVLGGLKIARAIAGALGFAKREAAATLVTAG